VGTGRLIVGRDITLTMILALQDWMYPENFATRIMERSQTFIIFITVTTDGPRCVLTDH
jgi:hypothetical protein